MSPAYPHLLLNCLPVDAALAATVLLAVAAYRRTLEGMLAIVTFVSGNFAPPALADVPGISRDQITFHQITGLAAMIVSVLVGLLASIPLVLTNIAAKRGVVIADLILALVLDAVFVYTAASRRRDPAHGTAALTVS